MRLYPSSRSFQSLLLSQEVAKALEDSCRVESWLLNRDAQGQAELLWLLPPDPSLSNGLLIGEVCHTAFRLALAYGAQPSFGYHYIGYLDLAVRSLQRLLEYRPEEGAAAIQASNLRTERSRLESLLMTPEIALWERLRALPAKL